MDIIRNSHIYKLPKLFGGYHLYIEKLTKIIVFKFENLETPSFKKFRNYFLITYCSIDNYIRYRFIVRNRRDFIQGKIWLDNQSILFETINCQRYGA